MREIFPQQARLGPADPLPDRITPAGAGLPGIAELIDELAARYPYPDRLWVRANMIASVDGAGAVAGRSGGLSGVADRLVFSVLRSLADVILVGAGTARAERYGTALSKDAWPRLRAGRPPAPRIAVVTRQLDLDLGGRLFAGSDDGGDGGRGVGAMSPARTIILTTRAASADRLRAAGGVADVIVAGDEAVSAGAAIDALTGLGYSRILVEGGPMLLGQLVAAGLLDELCLTVSPVLEGGHAGRITVPPQPASAAGGSGPSGSGVSPGGTVPPRASTPGLTGLKLAMMLEDDGFLLTRYLRADAR